MGARTSAALAAVVALLLGGLHARAALAADASTEEGSALSEIVVTAERRAENIQEVPLSVTAISGTILNEFDEVHFDDYAHMVPNLSFGTGNTFGITNGREITIRGISGFNTTSYYINDTPLPISIDPRAIDLDHIEVLRGPQGTLFGSSAMGGTVRLITRQPDLTRAFGSADAQVYDIHEGGIGYLLSASYNLPILDNQMALSLSGYSTYSPGVFTGQYGLALPPVGPGPNGPWPVLTVPASQPVQSVSHLGNDVEQGETISLTYRPAALDALTITPMVMHQDQSNNGFPLADYSTSNLIQVRPLNIREGDTDIWTFANLTAKYAAPFGAFIESATYFHRYSRDTEDGSELISIGGYGGPPVPTCVAGVYCASPSPNWVNSNQFTDELRFESGFPGPFQIVAGGYFTKLRQFIISAEVLPYDALGNPAFTENIPRVNEESAAFLSGTYDITDKIKLSAGVRQSHLEYSNAYIANGWINGGPSDSPVSSNQHATTPRFTAKYKFNDANMIYANAAKGYRIGGANSQLPSGTGCPSEYTGGSTPFGSDDLWSYEVGSKNSFLDGRFNSRLAAYRINWNQIQQSILLACSFHVTENVGSAVSRGGELELDGTPFAGLYINMGVGFEDAAITSAPPGSPLPVGSALNGVPRWTGSLLGDYSFPTFFGKGFVRGQYSFTGRSVSDNNPVSVINSALAQRERGSYSLANLFLGGKLETWEASLFIKNLADVRGNLGDEQSEISELPGRPRWMITEPRTIGIDIKKQF